TDPVVSSATATVTQATDPVVSSATATVTQATEPVAPATGSAGSAVNQAVDTVTSTAGQATAPVQPITDTVAAASSGATRAAESVASGQVGSGATGAADAVSGATTEAAHQALAAAGGGSGGGGGGGAASLADTAAHAAHGSQAGLAHALASPGEPAGLAHALAPPVDPAGLAAPPAPDPTSAALLGNVAPASAPTPGGAAHGTATDTLAQVATDPRLLAVTGVTALAGTAYVAARAAGCVAGGEQSVILTNVRLIPCLAKSSMAAGATAVAGFGSGVRQAAGSASQATRAEIHVLGEHVSSAASKARQDLDDHVVEPFRDGIARATGDVRGEGETRGSDLFFLGIGMVVGLLYAAILSLWLFLVRPRWSTRA
ncbi:MAG: hypothetical protein ABUM26_04630, partial [Solirubrobacterales bacterium]